MPKEKKGKAAKRDGYTGLILLATPILALLGTAILHWTMQVFLQTNLWLRFLVIVWVPIYTAVVIAGPPLLIALGIWYFIRRTEIVFWVVLYVGVHVWGFWYRIPPIVENWGEFMRFVEWLNG